MTLLNSPKKVTITEIPDDKVRAQLIRFNILEGSTVKVEKLYSAVLLNDNIAIGLKLAGKISTHI